MRAILRHQRARAEQGLAVLLTVLCLVPLLTFAAMGVDVASWYSRMGELQRAADAAALAGTVWMPNLSKATTTAHDSLARNGIVDGADDMTVEIGDNEARTVGNRHVLEVGGDRKVTVDADDKLTVTKDQTTTVKGNEGTTVDGNRSLTIKGKEEVTISGGRTEKAKADRTLEVGGNRKVTVSATMARTPLMMSEAAHSGRTSASAITAVASRPPRA